MGLASALSTALTGMTAAETTIDVVGNNLANSNTVGFKASVANFATQFLQTRSLGSGPTTTSGGTNPRQTGLGTMVADITPDFNQGTIEISANPTDLAIQGDGFFMVQGNASETLYTRNGIFKLNSQNEMVTTMGNRVLGHGIDDQFIIQSTTLVPLEIPLGQKQVAQATESVVLEGTLAPNGDLATTAEVIDTAVLGDSAYIQPAAGFTASAVNAPSVAGVTLADGGAGTGAIPAGTYYYRVVYADSLEAAIPNTEGTPSGDIDTSVVVAGANSSVDLTGLPRSADYSHARIYRSSTGAAGSYKLVHERVMPAAVWNYNDTAAAGTTTLNTDAMTGNYTYYVTFATANGGPGNGSESRPRKIANSENVSAQRIQLNSLPVDGTGAWGYRRLYRNLATDENTFYYIGDIDDDVTTTYTDNATDAAILANNQQLDREGPAITEGTLLTNLLLRDNDNYNKVFDIPTGETGSLAFTARKGGRLLTTKDYTITSTSTVGNLLDFMEDSMGIQEAPGPDPNNVVPNDGGIGGSPGGKVASGKLRLVGNNGVDNALQIQLNGMQLTTSTGTDNVNLPFTSVQTAVGESAVADFIAYDSLGEPLSVRLTTVLESRNSTTSTYRWFATSGNNAPSTGVETTVGTGLISFDGNGNFTAATESDVTIQRRSTPAESPLVFTLDFSQISGLATDASTLAVSYQDGTSPGNLTSFIVGEDGKISGVFSNGATRDLGQIRLARFANPNGLEQKGENLFAEGVNSGLPTQGNPGQQGIGDVISGATELSNTDIGSNLIDLILASTMYRGNTRVITTAQQMLDELLSLRR